MPATILIPTRDRPAYLDATLASVAPQAVAAGAELIVIDDGEEPATATVAASHRVRRLSTGGGRGANAARNLGIRESRGDPVVLIDDDIRAPAGWLTALLHGVDSTPGYEVFGGPIRPALDGGGPRSCGREGPPITALDLGETDRDAEFVWSANMAIRRAALDRLGPFCELLRGRGEEEEWERRYRAAGGQIRYLAGAGVEHVRRGEDARLPALSRASYALGRTARRYDVLKGTLPTLRGELRTLIGCLVHVVRFRCPNMIPVAAHSAGRVRETLSPVPHPPTEDFVSGTSGEVSGIRATTRGAARDAVCDASALVRLERLRLRRAVRGLPQRRVLVLAVERTDQPNLLAAARRELARSRHEVSFHAQPVGFAGKFENLDELLRRHPAAGHDWLIALDDDVVLPRGFLDTFLFLAERFDFSLVQPAHRWRSHAGWRITRRRPGLVAHETRFVEIGPVSAFHSRTFDALLPFPPLRFGWGLELHWSALARAHGWREGIIDATPITHGLRRVASAYAHDDALAEARAFLADHPYTTAAEAQRPVALHRDWR